MAARIEAIQADITMLRVDAIVNAANPRLLGGGGVDGAIHRAAGSRLFEACKRVPEVLPGVRCLTGEARITRGFDLPARYVIHTVGPVWYDGSRGEDELLANCYRNSLKLASENQIKSIAFPAISTGAYRFPFDRATSIAVRVVREYSARKGRIDRVVFTCFDERALDSYRMALGPLE